MSTGKNILVSACLLGCPCRFDGEARPSEAVISLGEHHNLISVCPEQLGGLKSPRSASEIVEGPTGRRVLSEEGIDRTAEFSAGAQAALEKARAHGCGYAVLKSKSPSCGSRLIFDGTFQGKLVPGQGITARLLAENGIEVVDETHLDEGLI